MEKLTVYHGSNIPLKNVKIIFFTEAAIRCLEFVSAREVKE